MISCTYDNAKRYPQLDAGVLELWFPIEEDA
jgi:hypothetical protein